VRLGRGLRLLHDLNGAAIWPPLHGVLAAAVLVPGGLDYRLAVLPSLCGWVATVLLAFLAARRLAPRWGIVAGLIAALFVAASPTHRGYALDIMLESLGAALTLAALTAYLVAVQERTPRAGCLLGLALSALFFHKYNYWLIVILSLAGSAVLTACHGQPAARATHRWRRLWAWLTALDWRGLVRAELRRPSSWLIAVVLALVAVVWAHGDRPFVVGGREVWLFPPNNILQVVYVLLFVRLVAWWRRGGRAWADGLAEPWRRLPRWHAWPVLVWLLLPKHFGYFVWFLSPSNADPASRRNLADGLHFYLRAAENYHPGPAALLLAGVLLLLGVLTLRRLRPGATAVLLCFVLGAFLALSHPNKKVRFAHSWLAAGWVLGGAGLAAALPRPGRPVVRLGLAAGAVAGCAWLLPPAMLARGPAPEGGPSPDQVSLLELTEFCGDDLAASRHAMVLCEVPVRFLTRWAVLERRGEADFLECRWGGFGPAGPGNRDGFVRWLQTTDCDTLVSFEETKPGDVCWEAVEEVKLHAELRDLLHAQAVFRPVRRQEFPHHGCAVTVWKRAADE
jgi:hypothetical protein